jgi:hypothetical protein
LRTQLFFGSGGLVDRILGKGEGAPGGKAGEDKKLAEQPPPEPGRR